MLLEQGGFENKESEGHTDQEIGQQENSEKEPQNHYALLGLQPDANTLKIRLKLKELKIAWHPDRFENAGKGKEEAKEMFDQILEAERVLLNKRIRAAYDKQIGLQGASPEKQDEEKEKTIEQCRYSIGDEVSVPRSNGAMEDDWVITKINTEKKEVEVRKNNMLKNMTWEQLYTFNPKKVEDEADIYKYGEKIIEQIKSAKTIAEAKKLTKTYNREVRFLQSNLIQTFFLYGGLHMQLEGTNVFLEELAGGTNSLNLAKSFQPGEMVEIWDENNEIKNPSETGWQVKHISTEGEDAFVEIEKDGRKKTIQLYRLFTMQPIVKKLEKYL